jgi:hypothetical protein
VILAGVCGIWKVITAWRKRERFVTSPVILCVVLAVAALLPLMWPMVREWFMAPTSYGAAPVVERRSQSLDLLSFFVPTCRHSFWGQWTQTIQLRTMARNRSVFLGYCAMAIAAYGLVRRGRAVWLWSATGLVFLVLSLGPYPRLWNKQLLTLPWGIPLIRLFRVSHRFHIMTSVSFAVLVGWGWSLAWDALSQKCSKLYLHAATLLASTVILFEYLSVPIGTVPIQISPFMAKMGEDPEEYAVVDLPLGREFGRYYMFQQMFHEKRLIEGVVSRTPVEAYTFIQGDVFWERLLENEDIDTTLADVSRHLVYLAENTRYVIVHRHLLTEDQLARWLDYFIITPLYEDDLIIVYPTQLEAGRDFEFVRELGDGIGIISATLSTDVLSQNGLLEVDLQWGSRTAPTHDWIARLALVSTAGEVAQTVRADLCSGWPTTAWQENAVARGKVSLRVDPFLAGGSYTATLALLNPTSGELGGDPVPLGRVEVQTIERTFEVPDMAVPVEAAFGDRLRLLGYDLEQSGESVHLTLHWKALERMETAYKFFVHLYDAESGELVAQKDVMPYDWSYPTTWWEAEEVVSDDIELPLEDVPPGKYLLGIGVYNPGTGERLAIVNLSDHLTAEQGRLTLPEEIVR